MIDFQAFVAADLEASGKLLVQDGNHGEHRPRPDEFSTVGTSFIRAADMAGGRLLFDKAEKINEVARKRIRKGIGKPLDVILSHKGTVGKTAFAEADCEPFVCSPQTTFWRSLDHQAIDPRYLFFAIRSPDFVAQLRQVENETDMAAYVPLTQQRRLLLSIPPLADQQAIVSVLGVLDDKIAVNDRIAETYEAIFRAKFAALGTSEDGDCLITELVDFNPRSGRASQDDAVYVDMAALPTQQSSIRTWSRRAPKGGSRFQNGDTLLARITPCLENGKTGYVDFLDDGETGTGSTEFIVMRSKGDVPPEFSYFLARDDRFREHAIRKMVGSSGRQRVSAADTADFCVRRPESDELATFGAEVSPAFQHLKSLMAESRSLEKIRDTLLPELMSGRLRVKDAEKVVEDAV